MSVSEMKRVAVLLGLVLALTGAFAGTARAADATPASIERMQDLDAAILIQLNAARAAHGLRPLVVSDQLETAAVAHSREMLEGGFFAHDSPGGATFVQRLKHYYTASGYSSWSAGENLIYNTAAMDAGEAIQVWLDSPPHRENMLDPTWREVGIGSLHAASAGGTFGGAPTWVITMDFGVRTGNAGPAKPAATVKTVAAHPTAAHKAKAKHAPKGKGKAKPQPAPKKTEKKPTRTLPVPPPPAPSAPASASPDTASAGDEGLDATTRHDLGDGGQDESTVDPGIPPAG